MPHLEMLIQTHGYWVIWLGTFLEGETILVLGGFAAYRGYLKIEWVILVAFFGSLSGDQFFFFMGRRHSEYILNHLPSWRVRIERAQRLMEKYHRPVILGFRFLYGFRTIIPFSLGMGRVSRIRFLIFDIIAALVWSIVIGMAGYIFGAALGAFIKDVKRYELLAMIGIALIGVLFYYAVFFHRKAPDEGKKEKIAS